MDEIYVHIFGYQYVGRRNRRSKTMFPTSYGPFRDVDEAREWIRQNGITGATKLMCSPARENFEIFPQFISGAKAGDQGSLIEIPTQQNIMQ